MGDLYEIDEIELRLRAELNEAENGLRNATFEERLEARSRFKDALHRFSVWVFTGRLERHHG